MKKLLLASSLLSLVLFLSACKPPAQSGTDTKGASFVGTDITGADFPKPLSLTDHNGQKRTMSDFKGKVVTLFFGYTHCPDVCPTTMVDLKQTMKLLGNKADEVQVIFVTVDPQRDTQEVLAQFVPSFDPRFNFKIYYSKVENKAKTDYTIDHSAGMYVFDKEGKIRLYLDYGQKPADIASDLTKLM